MADFYTIEQRDGRWWFIAPDGAPFCSIGMNHIDSAALGYGRRRRFRNSPGSPEDMKAVLFDLYETLVTGQYGRLGF